MTSACARPAADAVDLHANTLDVVTRNTLAASSERWGLVHVVITGDEHRAHWNLGGDTAHVDTVTDHRGAVWVRATDQLTGRQILISRRDWSAGGQYSTMVELA